MVYVGIDFGSCYVKYAICNGGEVIRDSEHLYGKNGFPNCYIKCGDAEYIGSECKTRDYYLGMTAYYKTDMRKDVNGGSDKKFNLLSGDFQYYIPYSGLATKVLAKVYSDILTDCEGLPVEGITVTVPASRIEDFNMASSYNDLLVRIMCSISKLDRKHVHIREEPVAASLAYFDGTDTPNERVLVFDLGGSTLDIAVIDFTDNKVVPVYVGGSEKVGSLEWDRVIGDVVCSELGDPGVQKRDPYEFSECVEKLKRSLGDRDAVVDFNGKPVSCNISDLMDIEGTADLLEATAEEVRKALLQVYDEPVTKVIMVGGGSRMPLIRNKVSESFPMLDIECLDDDKMNLAVARGAAIYSEYVDNYSDVGFTFVGKAAHTYGIGVEHNGVPMINNVIFRDTEYGSENEIRRFATKVHLRENGRRSFKFYVYETEITKEDCEDGTYVRHDGSRPGIKKVKVSIDPSMVYRSSLLEYTVELVYDFNGVLQVVIYLNTSGGRQRLEDSSYIVEDVSEGWKS